MAWCCALNTSTTTTTGHISHPIWTGAGSDNWSIEWDLEITDLSANRYPAGSFSGGARAIQVSPTGAINLLSTAGVSTSAAGVIAANTRYKIKLESVGTTKNIYVKLANAVSYGAAVCTGTDNTAYSYNSVGRASATYGRVFNVYGFSTSGGTYTTSWDSSNAPSTGTAWTSSGGQVATLTNFTGTADAWWIYYNSITALPIPNNTLGAALRT